MPRDQVFSLYLSLTDFYFNIKIITFTLFSSIKIVLDSFQLLQNKPRGLYFSKTLFEGFVFGGAYIRRGLSTEGNLRFKIDRASLKVESKFKVFALSYFVFEGNFPSTSPGGLYLEGRFNGGFFELPVWGASLYLEGLIHRGAYFRNFTVF